MQECKFTSSLHAISLETCLKLSYLYFSPLLYLFLVAPIKALCSQRFEDWKEKFEPIGLLCKELTGDTAMDDLFEIQHAHIILTTPVSFTCALPVMLTKKKDAFLYIRIILYCYFPRSFYMNFISYQDI